MPGTLALALLPLLAAARPPASDPVPPAVKAALARALAVPGGRVEIAGYRPALPPDCAVVEAEAARKFEGAARLAIRLLGRDGAGAPCEGWAWATVRVFAPAWVTSRRVNEGEPLAGAVQREDREIGPSRTVLVSLPPEARATRSLAAGTLVEPGQLRVGPAPGQTVTVSVQLGALSVERPGRIVPCRPGRTCAVLASGKRVEGSFEDGHLLVDTP